MLHLTLPKTLHIRIQFVFIFSCSNIVFFIKKATPCNNQKIWQQKGFVVEKKMAKKKMREEGLGRVGALEKNGRSRGRRGCEQEKLEYAAILYRGQSHNGEAGAPGRSLPSWTSSNRSISSTTDGTSRRVNTATAASGWPSRNTSC